MVTGANNALAGRHMFKIEKIGVLVLCFLVLAGHSRQVRRAPITTNAKNSSGEEKTGKKHGQSTIPATFGTTHFVVGMLPSDVAKLKHERTAERPSAFPLAAVGDAPLRRAFFSPDDGIAKILIELIDSEQKSMRIAVYQFTDIDVARALNRAKERGVAIEIVTDPACLLDRFNKITWLQDMGFTLYIYNPDASKASLSNKMHHKFVVFGKNVGGKRLVWLGSYNFTKSANTANQESVVLLEDEALIVQFEQQFTRLKERSRTFTDFAKHNIVLRTNTVAKKSRTSRHQRHDGHRSASRTALS